MLYTEKEKNEIERVRKAVSYTHLDVYKRQGSGRGKRSGYT